MIVKSGPVRSKTKLKKAARIAMTKLVHATTENGDIDKPIFFAIGPKVAYKTTEINRPRYATITYVPEKFRNF